jgi:hypothetical protein
MKKNPYLKLLKREHDEPGPGQGRPQSASCHQPVRKAGVKSDKDEVQTGRSSFISGERKRFLSFRSLR